MLIKAPNMQPIPIRRHCLGRDVRTTKYHFGLELSNVRIRSCELRYDYNNM